ncbi:NAD-dependent epimerase/dehydratase family protein [Streptomyces chryseus]
MTTIAITGASGFCGSHVAAAAAARGFDVLSLGRRPSPIGRHVPWDAATEVPDLSGADLVVHCAAAVGDPIPGSPAEAAMRAVNVGGTVRLLEAVDGQPVVLISSASVYAPGPDRSRVTEDHPVHRHLNAYGRAKAEGEAVALAAGAVVLRPRAVYGRGDPHLAPRLLSRVRAGMLLLPGRDVRLSLTAVENLTEACLAATDWPPGAYNIADPTPYWRDEAIRAILRSHGVQARIGHLPLPVVQGAARVVEGVSRLSAAVEPTFSRYAVDQLAHSIILDVSKAEGQGWVACRSLNDYTDAISSDFHAASKRWLRRPRAY